MRPGNSDIGRFFRTVSLFCTLAGTLIAQNELVDFSDNADTCWCDQKPQRSTITQGKVLPGLRWDNDFWRSCYRLKPYPQLMSCVNSVTCIRIIDGQSI